MKRNWKLKGKTMAIPAGLAIGALISMIVTIAGSATTAHLALKQRIGETGIGYAIMLILFAAAALGAWGAFSCIKKLRLQICLMSAGIYYIVLLAMTALFFGGQYQRMWVTALIILIGSMAVAFFPGKRSGKINLKKRAYC